MSAVVGTQSHFTITLSCALLLALSATSLTLVLTNIEANSVALLDWSFVYNFAAADVDLFVAENMGILFRTLQKSPLVCLMANKLELIGR